MKQSFFLVIPKQKNNPQRMREFEEKVLERWIAELPIANPLLASRLVYDYITELNTLKMPAQLRLDTLEKLRPSFLSIEEYLRSRLLKADFPKEENDKKTFKFLVTLEREFTLSYWIALKEISGQSIGWFQGKNTTLAIQRCIKGLSNIIKSHLMMGVPVSDWIWIDLHSLYKLSLQLKRHSTQIPLNDQTNKTSSPEECYIEIVLLTLANAKGLMQREIKSVANFTRSISSLISFKNQPVIDQQVQCIILTDEDKPPFFQTETIADIEAGAVKVFVDFTALYQLFDSQKIPVNRTEARFSALNVANSDTSERLTADLLDYLKQRWLGIPLESTPLFNDRLDRYISIGLTSIFKLQTATDTTNEEDLEILAHSASNQLLSCVFKKPGVLSIGSLISFRKADAPINKRALGIVNQLIVDKENGKLTFGMTLLAPQAIAINYLPLLSVGSHDLFKKALFYQTKEQETKSHFITDTFMLKAGDSVRLFIDHEEFDITLKNKKNVGLGYWQFECLKALEKKNLDTD